jgi:hypothetical protein
MAYTPNWLDRLRIERVVWTLDTLLTIVPGKRRRAIRRETRANLRAASADVGTAEAIRRLGDLRPLAVEYTGAHYGEQRRRPSLWGALIWSQLAALALVVVTVTGLESFLDGVEAAGSVRGTHDWTTLSPVVSGHAEYDASGRLSGFGFEISVVFLLVYVLVALVVGGRLWRLVLWRPARISRASDESRG